MLARRTSQAFPPQTARQTMSEQRVRSHSQRAGMSSVGWGLLALALGLSSACGDPSAGDGTRRANVGGSGNSGDFGGGEFGGAFGVADAGDSDGEAPADDCAEGAEWIYLVDNQNNLLQFRPDSLGISAIGKLQCPTSAGDTPFSMAVDRDARAWVLFQSGNIFRVNTLDASCTATGYQANQQGMPTFGMGFASNDSGGGETLFVAGGTSLSASTATLAWIDTQSLQLTPITQISGWPELTGTGSGQLWGFSPNTKPPLVQRINKTTGSVIDSFQVQTLQGSPSAWAFAFWGGGFYIFLERAMETSTNIWFFDPATQSLSQTLSNIGRRIVGAGVSTCAPLVAPK